MVAFKSTPISRRNVNRIVSMRPFMYFNQYISDIMEFDLYKLLVTSLCLINCYPEKQKYWSKMIALCTISPPQQPHVYQEGTAYPGYWKSSCLRLHTGLHAGHLSVNPMGRGVAIWTSVPCMNGPSSPNLAFNERNDCLECATRYLRSAVSVL
ncbi:hypothetical protein BJX62DRAFT_33914 [Aspergillus germanicus]